MKGRMLYGVQHFQDMSLDVLLQQVAIGASVDRLGFLHQRDHVVVLPMRREACGFTEHVNVVVQHGMHARRHLGALAACGDYRSTSTMAQTLLLACHLVNWSGQVSVRLYAAFGQTLCRVTMAP